MSRQEIVDYLEELKNKLNPHKREELDLIGILSSVQGAVIEGNTVELMQYTLEYSQGRYSKLS